MFILVCSCTNFDKFLRMELSGTLTLLLCYVGWNLLGWLKCSETGVGLLS